MIALLDYDSGNLRSVHKALVKVGGEVRIVREPEQMSGAASIVLPGVGAFDDCIHSLRKQELLEGVASSDAVDVASANGTVDPPNIDIWWSNTASSSAPTSSISPKQWQRS